MTKYDVILISTKKDEPTITQPLVENTLIESEVIDFANGCMEELKDEFLKGELPQTFIHQFLNGVADYEIVAYKKGKFGKKTVVQADSLSNHIQRR